MSRQMPAPAPLPSVESSKSFWHSKPSSLLLGHRSTRDLPLTADVVVIGSGITGTSIAYHLLHHAKNLRVVMLEAREACWGATGRNGGHCQPIFFEHPNHPDIGRFELANFHALSTLIDDKHIDCEFVAQRGVRAIYSERHLKTIQQALETIKTTAPDLATRMRITTDKHELAELRISTALGAIITDVAARMWPYKFVSHILEELLTSTEIDGSFNLQTLTPVTHLTPSPVGVTVTTDRGPISAAKVVLATNAYTSHLLPEFADLIVPCRGQMSSLEPFYSLKDENRLTTSLGFLGDGLDDYLIQRPSESGGHLMFGGGRQCGPSLGETDDSIVDQATAKYLRTRLVEAFQLPEGKAACTYCVEHRTPCPLPTQEMSVHDPRCTTCIGHSQLICQQTYKKPPKMKATHMWTGIMGFSRDDLPWVGQVPESPNVFMAAGFTGHGMPNTWLCGKAVALSLVLAMQGGEESSDEGVMKLVQEATGLPEGYIVSRERMDAARELGTVEERDWAEMRGGN